MVDDVHARLPMHMLIDEAAYGIFVLFFSTGFGSQKTVI